MMQSILAMQLQTVWKINTLLTYAEGEYPKSVATFTIQPNALAKSMAGRAGGSRLNCRAPALKSWYQPTPRRCHLARGAGHPREWSGFRRWFAALSRLSGGTGSVVSGVKLMGITEDATTVNRTRARISAGTADSPASITLRRYW